jgi:hypothetical protein
VLQGGLAVVVSPSLRQSGFLFRKLTRHLIASDAAFRRETMTEVELVSGGLAVSLPGDRPAMLRGLSLRHDGPAVLIVDEASRVRDELWATISPMLAAAPAAQQILLSTPAGASGAFHRAWSGSACRSLPISVRVFPLSTSLPSASASAMLSTGKSISAPSSRRRAASSTPRFWRTCSAIIPCMSPRERYPFWKDEQSIASCNEAPARPCAQDKRGGQDRP